MKVRVELHAVLRDLIPGGKGEVELGSGATVLDLLNQVGVDTELRELVTVNGTQIEDFSQTLQDEDTISVFPAVAGGDRSAYLDEGIRLFKEGDYFLAHETLEEYWIEAPEPERDFYQGLIHLAVGFHHLARANSIGAKAQFRKASNRLAGYSGRHEGVDVDGIRDFLEGAADKVDRGEKLEPPALDERRRMSGESS